jgi:chemotaxis protein CheD
MRKPSHVIEIFLQPGEFYFGNHDTRIRTLLGSCISITVWHPQLLIGGMCHYLLPTRGLPRNGPLNGRYADEALEFLVNEIRRAGTRPAEYQAKLFGGSGMFAGIEKTRCPSGKCDPFAASCKDVSCRNRRSAHQLLAQHGFFIKAENLGGTKPHNVLFDIWSGHVWLKRPPNILKPADPLPTD